jgi:hypothetical protein
MTSTTYRAAYFLAEDGGCIVLTRSEHASMSDEELAAEALAEAQRMDMIDMIKTDPAAAWPRLTRQQFAAGLTIGEWRE